MRQVGLGAGQVAVGQSLFCDSNSSQPIRHEPGRWRWGAVEGQADEQAWPVSISVKATVSSRKVTDAGWSRNPKVECNGEVCKVDREGPPSQARGRKDLVPAWTSHICEAGRGSLPGWAQPGGFSFDMKLC